MSRNKLSENQKINLDEKEEIKDFYEISFFLAPQLTDNEVEEALNELKEHILKNGGEIIYIEPWKLQKIAYPIQKNTEGYFSFIQFKFDKEKIEDFQQQVSKDKKILRYLLIRLNPKEDIIIGLEEKKPEFKPKMVHQKTASTKVKETQQIKEEEEKEISLEELEKKIEEILKQ